MASGGPFSPLGWSVGYIRTLAADPEDGRWTWETSGTPLPFADLGSYSARLIRDRLTRTLLVRYLGERVSFSPRTMTLAEARAYWELT